MKNSNVNFFKDVLIGAVGGLIGTVVLEGISSKLYEMENEQARKKEDELRKEGDPPAQLAKRVSDDVLRLNLPEDKKDKLAMGIHYGFGAMAGALFGALAPRAPFLSAGLGTVYGTLFWLLGDEIGMPMMGISKPSQDYPWQTHVRALAAHLGYGAAVAGTYKLAKKIRAA
jgi:uncharacterized membrane protein YagU involved in acid resistance